MSMRKNIGFVLASKLFGGAETIVKEILRKINLHEFNVYLFIDKDLIKFFKDLSNIKIINLGDLRTALPFHPTIFIARKILLKSVKKYNISLLNFHLPHSLFLKKDNKIINIFTIHGTKYLDPVFFKSNQAKYNYKSIKNIYFLIRYYFEKWIYIKQLKKTDFIISACDFFLDLLSKNGIKNKKVKIENGVDLSIIKNRKKILKNREAIRIFYSGGSRNVKGWDILLKAINKIAKKSYSFKIFFLREVPKSHTIRKYVKSKKLQNYIEFIGFCKREKYLDYMYSCDFVCLPSYIEGIAASLMDCLALGKPIVTTKVGGTPEVIKDGVNGFLCQPTSSSLAKTLEKALKNKQKLEEMSNNNLEKAIDYSWDLVIKKYENLFKKIIKNWV